MASQLDEMFDRYTSAHRQWLDLCGRYITSVQNDRISPDNDANDEAVSVSRALLQTFGAVSSTTFSYACSIQSIISKFQASLLNQDAADSDANYKRALLVENLRIMLREVGDSASREGRHFQHQLMIIAEQLAQSEAIKE
jgi:hypothetical protein